MEKKNSSTGNMICFQDHKEIVSHVPECHHLDIAADHDIDHVPVINLAILNDPTGRSILVEEIANACRRNGFFQVINHGISQEILDGALNAASGFFNLASDEDKAKYMSSDVHKPVRYGKSVRDGADRIQFWRAFLKHYAHPLTDWIGLWPDTPPYYRERMGEYTRATQKLAQTMTSLVTESLGLGPEYLRCSKLGDQAAGMHQVMVVNCYPRCPVLAKTLGLPPHTDYSCITVLLQDSPGLQILDSSEAEVQTWRDVPVIHGALQVQVGDQLEVLSNGKYKSPVHKVVVNNERTRISVAGLHTLAMDEKIGPAGELVDEDDQLNVKGSYNYKESCFRDFLDFISKNDLGDGTTFMDTLRKQPRF